MTEITQKSFKNIDPKSNIQALLVEGSNPILFATNWAQENNYQLLSVMDVYKKAGFGDIYGIKKIKYNGEMKLKKKENMI